MNHSFRLIWNPDTQRYVPAPECAKGRGKSQTRALAPAAVILGAVLALPVWAQAPPAANQLPTGGQVVSGSAAISQTTSPSGSQMTVNQGSQKAIIDWSSFDIGKNAGVNFVQPNASAIALNRVTAGDASQIHGQLSANGQVWLINPNGVVFGQGSRVDVGGLVASTLNITNADFNNGNYRFTRNGATGSISNQGEITAKDGGNIALLAPTVSNDGILRAQLGTVALAAGDQITLQAGANGLLNVQVDPATVRTLIENKQLIVADGGQVIMTGKAADALSASVVANTGTIQANTLQERDGKILLIADMQHGETQAAGQLEAKFVETSAATVSIDKDLKVNTHGGQWLIDPVDITIDQGKATAIETALGTGDVVISTADGANNGSLGTNGTGSDAGDITVNAAITWDKDSKLTLRADNNIAINASITAKHADGKLALLYGQGSSDGKIGGVEADYAINMGNGASVNLQSGQNFFTQKGSGGGLTTYTVVNDVTALKAAMWGGGSYALGSNLDLSGVTWGNYVLYGKFDGLGHTLSNLGITRLSSYAGLFGEIGSGADLRHIGLVNANILQTDSAYVGGLAGWNSGSIRRAYVTGQISSGSSLWTSFVGGLVGINFGSISDSYSTAQAKASGGYSVYVGGLVGYNALGSISRSYATGTVSGSAPTATAYVGGLVGWSDLGSIDQTYATGQVTGSGSSAVVGGLVGINSGTTITNSFWNKETTGQSSSAGSAASAGKTTAEMQQTGTYTGWDFNKNWRLVTPGAGTDGYVFYGLPTLQGVTPKTDYQYFDSGTGTGANPWVLTNWQQLQNINFNTTTLGGTYQLTADLSKSSAGYSDLASATANSGAGWKPIGAVGAAFTGSFDGQNHTIGDLNINRSNQYYVGLFGYAQNATLGNLGVVDANVTGGAAVGALVGENLANGGTASISNVYATGQVSGGYDVGGLVGLNYASGSTGKASISNAYATAQVTVWSNGSGGGLVSRNAGYDGGRASISNAYATGQVTVLDGYGGGLVGENLVYDGSQASISNVYATGQVTASTAGGLVGSNYGGTVTNSFWNTETMGQTGVGINSGSDASAGKTTAQLADWNTFTGWDSNVWGTTQKGDASVAGYEVSSSLPFLRNLTREQDKTFHTYTLFAGGLGTAGNAWTLGSWQQLQNINFNTTTLGGTYQLTANLDKNSAGYSDLASATANNGAGWKPIGNENTIFTGNFDGQNHTIGDLTINRPTEDNVGLFGKTQNATLTNVGLVDAHVTGGGDVGALVGWNRAESGTSDIRNVFATGEVSGVSDVGGLVGYFDAFNNGTVNIINAYATAAVSATGSKVGGLVGRSYADKQGRANISNSYATGAVSGTTTDAGGLVGVITGVSSASNITDSFWDTETTGQSSSAGSAASAGKTTAELQKASTFAAWDSDISASGGENTVWRIYEGQSGPLLRGFLKQVTVTADASSITGKTYDGTAASGTASYITNVSDATLGGSLGYASTSKNAGSYSVAAGTLVLGGLYSGQQGYDISYANTGELTIDKATLTLAAVTDSKTYDGSATSGQTVQVTGLVSGDTLTGLGQSFDSKNAGTRTLSVDSGYVVNDGNGGNNYSVSTQTAAGAIDKATLTLAAVTDSKTYDGSATSGQTVQVTGLVSGDTLTGLGQSFDSKNAGTRTLSVDSGYVVNDGNGGNNYSVSTQTAAGTINKAALTVSTSDVSKTYDGTTAANGTAIVTGGQLFGADKLSGGSFAYADKNAGTGKTVTVAGVTVADGNGGGNYDVSYVANTSSTIDKANATVTANSGSASYNGQAQNVMGYTVSGLVNNEDKSVLTGLSESGGVGRNAGSYAHTVSGTDGNYNLTFTDGALTIDKATITVSTGDVSKTYDGTTAANGTAIVTGGQLFGADKLSGGSFAYTDKNAGTGKTVTVSGVTVADGNGGGNYDVSYVANTSSTINKAAITVSTGDVSKTYDGSTSANGTAIVTGGQLFGADKLSGGSFAYTDKNAGTGKTVTVAGVTVADGNGGGNYDVTYANNTSSTIDKAALTITASNVNKILGSTLALDGSTGFTASGLVQGETVGSVTLESEGARSDAMVGSYAVKASNAVNGGGFDAGNYDIRYVDGSLTVISLLTGGVIWREARVQGQPQPTFGLNSDAGSQVASSGVPHLTLTPGFIRMEGEE